MSPRLLTAWNVSSYFFFTRVAIYLIEHLGRRGLMLPTSSHSMRKIKHEGKTRKEQHIGALHFPMLHLTKVTSMQWTYLLHLIYGQKRWCGTNYHQSFTLQTASQWIKPTGTACASWQVVIRTGDLYHLTTVVSIYKSLYVTALLLAIWPVYWFSVLGVFFSLSGLSKNVYKVTLPYFLFFFLFSHSLLIFLLYG